MVIYSLVSDGWNSALDMQVIQISVESQRDRERKVWCDVLISDRQVSMLGHSTKDHLRSCELERYILSIEVYGPITCLTGCDFHSSITSS